MSCDPQSCTYSCSPLFKQLTQGRAEKGAAPRKQHVGVVDFEPTDNSEFKDISEYEGKPRSNTQVFWKLLALVLFHFILY